MEKNQEARKPLEAPKAEVVKMSTVHNRKSGNNRDKSKNGNSGNGNDTNTGNHKGW